MNDDQMERCYLRRVVLAVLGLIVCFALAYCPRTQASAIARAEGEATVTLYDEPCALDAVTNLSFRATWQEGGGEIIEGCFGMHPQLPVAIFYFADKTVAIIHRQAFGPVTGT